MIRGLEELLQRLVKRRDVLHAVVAVVRGDDSFRWIGAAGEARTDGTPMRPDTPFCIASIDKLLTATVILKLHERGRIGLDQTIADFLPRKSIEGLHRFRGVEYTDTIRVRHLLGHTSGLPDWLEDRPKGGRSLVENLIRDGDRSPSVDELLHLVRSRLVPHFPPQPLEAKRPKLRYSDTNFILLTSIIESVAGQPLHRVHEKLLFRPLEMLHTWVAGHSAPFDPTPEPATLWASAEPLDIPELISAIRGIYSTVDDMLRFLKALAGGAVFEHPETAALMGERWNRFGLPFDRAALRLPTWPIEYGLGIMRFEDPIRRWFGRLPRAIRPFHRIPAVVGHTGSTGCWLFHCPERDLLLSGTVDQITAGALPFRIVPGILRLVERHGEFRKR